MARVVLVESFYGGSHRAWVDGWARASRHEVALVTHDDQFWRWRLRGGAVTLAEAFDAHVMVSGRPDVVVVSSMVDAAAFAGLARNALGSVPIALYCHESQLLYPPIPDRRIDTDAVMANWQSLVAAQAVWFNSDFHRTALRRSLPGFLRQHPDPNHAHLVDSVFERSRVLWPGVEVKPLIGARRPATSVPNVLWNQRWDHDKNPHSVFAALAALAEQGVPFTLALAGQNQRPDRADFAWVHERLGERIVHDGYADDAVYRSLLGRADVVVSAADHEFFGIALVEAIAAGAVPVLPDRLSFPELIEPRWHGAALYGDGELRTRLAQVLTDLDASRRRIEGLRESMMRFDWSVAAPAHDRAVDELADLASRSMAPTPAASDRTVRVGHWTSADDRTGCTVVLFGPGTVASGEVRGGAPATREFALLDPRRTVSHVDAVVLTGGSAFGLAAAEGVVSWLAERGRGFPTRSGAVPIVVAMALFDLDPDVAPPGPASGRDAVEAARETWQWGRVGAGAGATVGKWRGRESAVPAGIGYSVARADNVEVHALIAVNASGDIDDGSTAAEVLAGSFVAPVAHENSFENTTIGVVWTNARLDKLGCRLMAESGHDGLGRALLPAHTSADGDALVAASTAEIDAPVPIVRMLATLAVDQAVRRCQGPGDTGPRE